MLQAFENRRTEQSAAIQTHDSIGLMKYSRDAQRELRDDPLELRPILRDHLVRPAHRADWRFELAPARVLVRLAGSEQRLFADYTQPAYFLNA